MLWQPARFATLQRMPRSNNLCKQHDIPICTLLTGFGQYKAQNLVENKHYKEFFVTSLLLSIILCVVSGS